MLNHISWTAYLTSVLTVVVIYYLWFCLRFYRNALTGRKFGRSDTAERRTFVPAIADVMGPVVDEPEKVNEPDELLFSESAPDDLPDQQSEDDHKRFGAEVKALIRVIREANEPKEHFMLLAGLLFEKYAAVTGDAHRDRIAEQLLDPANGFAFELHAWEINELWHGSVNV